MLIEISIACIIISFVWRAMGNNYYIAKAYINFFSPTMALYSICIFTLFSTITVKKDLSKLAAFTFEIYLFHTLILKEVASAILNSNITPVIGVIVMTLGTFLVSLIIAIGFKKLWKKIISKMDRMVDGMKIWNLLS